LKLVSAQITRYRSVEDSEKFAVEPGVTCLVGKNESGKTNVLQALSRANPVEPYCGLDEDIDYPARLNRERRQAPPAEMIPVVAATFRYDPAEVTEIENDIGPGALLSPDFTVTVGYRSGTKFFGHRVDESAITKWLSSQLDLPSSAAAALAAESTVAGLLLALESLQEAPAAAQEMAARIRGWRDGSATKYLIDTYASPRLPKFVYFADYDAMPGKISIPDLIRRRDTGGLSRGEQALLSLLTMAGVAPEEFQQAGQHERLIRALEIAGNEITDEVFRYWTQNRELEVKLEILQPEEGAQPPLNEPPILQIRVLNRRHRVSVAFDERSRGFVWFFSFLTYFNKLEEAATSNLILLLDEPGLSLHARAQQDLLRLIDDRLAPRHQVIYSTHSPFMVSADHFERVRTVIDYDNEGTKVSAEVFKADEDTAFPLLTAMGVELTNTLFVGEHTLLLEGPSDLIYLDVFGDLAVSHGMAGLDPRWVKAPVGGSGKLSTFVTLLGANKLHVAVVVDSSTKDTGAVRRLRDNGQLAANGLIEISQITGTKDADIEDLFNRDFYLKLVSLAYDKELPAPLTAADINAADPRVVRAVEMYFAQNNIAGGKFDHYRPAAILLRQQATLLPQIGQDTINRGAQLLQRINTLLT
jgi:predicted ATPase